MDTSELYLFLSLSNFLSFRRTAEHCAVTPSTLSRAVARMEDELNAKLFERDNQSVRLTAAGQKFRDFAGEYYLKYLKVKEELKAVSENMTGNLKIFCSVTACVCLLPELLNQYRFLYPNIDLKIETGDAAQAMSKIINHEADLSIAAIPPHIPQGLVTHGFTKIPLVFIAPKKIPQQWLKKGGIDQSVVPYVVSEQGALRREINAWFSRNSIKPNIIAEVAGNEAIVSLVALGMGIAIIPEAVIMQSASAADIQIIDRPGDIPPFNVGLCTSLSKNRDRAVKAFIDVAKNSLPKELTFKKLT
ncbi:HTH-type transcriptional activator IlvY [uncultured Ruminobacter sp.]|jgi:LysR family positive regulator for ilvC|uniref:HTH-type transcriptional activator IlvY n=1 Tax=uncultured Ruminobacter sp. TaxID=538947 RepID=UPI0025F71F7B|nr:HTH-type transcriptional activator IlvY [uncultured Ruminobacter sp.]